MSDEIKQAYLNYKVSIGVESTYDIDELICILHQFEAIMMGLGMDFTVEFVEEVNSSYVWEAK